ncbi:MAG: methylmalonyl-CoA mutase family protein, partial [Caldimonas sp.]
MNKPIDPQVLAGSAHDDAHLRWQADYRAGMAEDKAVVNVSGVPIQPLYTAADTSGAGLGYPGQPDFTRGIYATMHRGRTWTQRQLVGLGTPADYNERVLGLLARG